MKIIVDTREQDPLEFSISDLEIKKECLISGDYTFEYDDGVRSEWLIERKSVSDLWGSFSSMERYKREKEKFQRARDIRKRFILAVEATCWEIRRGHEYHKSGEIVASKKDGLSMVRQLMTISQKYDVPVWYCNGRSDMAFRIIEWFLARNRIKR